MEILIHKCSVCRAQKPITCFHRDISKKIRYSNTCKECAKNRSRIWRNNNLEKSLSSSRQRYKTHKKIHNEKIRIYHNRKRREDPMFKFKSNMRTRLWKFFRNISKSKKTENILGCSWDFARMHIQSNFRYGMSWDNYGKWHVDHIEPLSLAKNKNELEKLCHYTNLQPLWAKDNFKKNDACGNP